MKIVKKLTSLKDNFMRVICLLSAMLITTPALAENTGEGDVIGEFMQSSMAGLFGSSSGFWKMFILADIGLAAAASMKSKNPMVFAGVFMTALIPGFLVKRYVFPSA